MKKKIIPALLLIACILSTSSLAASTKQNIEVTYGISLTYDGKPMSLKSATGESTPPFVFNGTTYVPIRAVSEYFGKSVSFDDATNAATITSASTYKDAAGASARIYKSMLDDNKYASDTLYQIRDMMLFILHGTSKDAASKEIEVIINRFVQYKEYTGAAADAINIFLASKQGPEYIAYYERSLSGATEASELMNQLCSGIDEVTDHLIAYNNNRAASGVGTISSAVDSCFAICEEIEAVCNKNFDIYLYESYRTDTAIAGHGD